MSNIFKENKAVNEHPNRNNFDLSKKSNVSLKFGTLYPVYCQPVVPGDSFDINVAYNFKLMPVIFPVQTKMRAHMHFFYVRNKNLWSNWENWISNLPNATQDLTPHPYIVRPDTDFVSGSIHDFLGVPTSAVSDSLAAPVRLLTKSPSRPLLQSIGFNELYLSSLEEYGTFGELVNDEVADWIPSSSDWPNLSGFLPLFVGKLSENQIVLTNIASDSFDLFSKIDRLNCSLVIFGSNDQISNRKTFNNLDKLIYYESSTGFVFNPDNGSLVLSDDAYLAYRSYLDNYTSFKICIRFDFDSTYEYPSSGSVGSYLVANSSGFTEYSDLGLDLYSNHLRINALPYRAYESIYWAYYNNNVVSPMMIDGQPQYNRYNTSLGDGADNTNYHLFQRNYELDFLTSALPSPQQGVAPLVGMTALGDVTIEDENGITTAHAEIDNDGTISKVVLTSPAASIDHARTAMNIAASGMSINDFRQTNALQRLLETNIRKGYRYLDFIAGHFGKEPEYRELDMPEFIGGFSRDVNVSTVVSSADTLGADSGKSLGSYGGFAQVVGGSQHSIRHYCDDYGYIIGIMSVVPTPCYSQLLPKHMIAPDNFLDYYFPEFSQSGLQPITYKEVAPIQSYLDSLTDPDKSLEDTFGYNRPNYDMVSAVDEVHGEFRGSLRNYVINRIFDSRPELGRDFLQINPSEINDIFVNTNPDDDTIIGEIGFSVHAKRPVPRVVIPNLGR